MNFAMKNYLPKVFFYLLLFLTFCEPLFGESNAIYVSHYFARQFFKYFNESKVSLNCKEVVDFVQNHENEDWALKLIDSSGTIASGLAKGNFQFMGDFDECLSIEVKQSNNLNGFHGQYCTLDLPIDSVFAGNTFAALNVSELNLNPSIGVCLPSLCSSQDLNQILKTYYNKTGLRVSVSHCTDTKNAQIKKYHILIISGFGALLLLIFIGTVIDMKLLFKQLDFSSNHIKSLVSFSIYNNTIKLFKTDNEKETIGCFHGFRLMSLLFIILYHIYTEAQLPSANLFEILESEKYFLMQIITNASLWVEAFFLLSGFLCAYGVIRDFRRTSIKEYNPLKNIVHRYLRLTPSLIGVIAFSVLQEIMASGPQWFKYIEISENSCHKYWWTNLLYINNIVGLNQLGQNPTECVGFTWYLAVDMQLFLISPLLIILLASNDLKKQYIGVGINIFVIIISWIITAVITANNGLTPTVLMNVYDLDYINKVYKQAYCRVGPYSVGILMAYFFIRYKGNINIKPVKNITFWLISIVTNLSITFLTWPWLLGHSYRNFASILYAATHRTIWSMSWSYMLFACATGHGGLINKILSWKALVPLSRLSFQAYLVHIVLISRFVYSARQPIYSSQLNLIMMFFQYTFLTFIVSYIAFLMFELPFANIERIFLRRNASKDIRVENTNINNNHYEDYGSSQVEITQSLSKL